MKKTKLLDKKMKTWNNMIIPIKGYIFFLLFDFSFKSLNLQAQKIIFLK